MNTYNGYKNNDTLEEYQLISKIDPKEVTDKKFLDSKTNSTPLNSKSSLMKTLDKFLDFSF